MPDDGLSRFEEVYNKLVRSGLDSLRNVNTREMARQELVKAIRSLLDRATAGRPDAEQYKAEFADKVATAIVQTEPFEQTFKNAQEVLAAVASYLEERLLIPARMRSAVDPLAGKSITPAELAAVQGAVSSAAVVARSLDDRLRARVEQKFSFNPALVLDSTIHFVQKVDASYNVTITRYDATVRLTTGFSLQRPLTSSANLSGSIGLEMSPGGGVTAYVKGTTRLDDLYHRPQIGGSQIGAGVAVSLSPNATITLDYSGKNVIGPQLRPEHSVFLGVKIRF